MMPYDPDDDLRRAFKHLRAEQERSAPPFHALWRRAQKRVLPRFSLRPLRFATAGLLLAAGMTLFIVVRRPPAARSAPAPVFLQVPPADSLDLIHWRSPTNELLNIPGAELLTTTFHPESHALPTPHPQGA